MAANLLLEKSAWDRTPEETVRRALGKVLLKPDRLAEVTQLLASRDTASDAKIADERHDKLANAARFSAERWAINLAAPEVDPGAVVSQFRIQFHKHLVRSIDESETPWAASMRLQGSEYADASFAFDGLIAALARSGVEVAALGVSSNFLTLLIRKASGTRLISRLAPASTATLSSGYSVSSYRPEPNDDQPIQVVKVR